MYSQRRSFCQTAGTVYRFSGKQITTHRKLSIPSARQRGSGILAQLVCVRLCVFMWREAVQMNLQMTCPVVGLTVYHYKI